MRAAGGLDGRASPLLTREPPVKDAVNGDSSILQIRRSHAWANANGTTLFSLLWGWRTVRRMWVACGGGEFEAWFSSVHKNMAYSRVTSLRTMNRM